MERAKVKRNEVGTEKEQTVPKYQRPRNDSSTSLLSRLDSIVSTKMTIVSIYLDLCHDRLRNAVM